MWVSGELIKSKDQFSAEKCQTTTKQWMVSVAAAAEEPDDFKEILDNAARYVRISKSDGPTTSNDIANNESGRGAVFKRRKWAWNRAPIAFTTLLML